MKFENYLKENDDISIIMETVMFMEDYDYLNEGIGDFGKKIKSFLPKLGIHAHKVHGGLIGMLGKAGKTMAKFFWHAMKAATGDEESKRIVKQLANKEIKKEDVILFLLKLDTLTLHLISGPIHMIEALTGWHIDANIKHNVGDAMNKAKQAIDTLLDISKTVSADIKKKIVQYVNGLKRLIGLHQTA